MNRQLLVIVTATLAFGSSALAEHPLTQPPSQDVAKAEGDRIIAAAGVGDLFENVSEQDVTRLRHKASGMICPFDPTAPGNVVHVYPVSRMTPNRGDNVSCGMNSDGASFTLYATRYRSMPSEAQDMAGAVAGIRGNWTEVVPLPGAFAVPAAEGRPNPQFAGFRGRHPNGYDAATFVIITHIDGWSFKTRASGPTANAQTVATMAGTLSSASLPPLAEGVAPPNRP